MIDDALSRTVIGCAMDVHRELGPGYLEKVYENALALALRESRIGVAQQSPVPARFRGVVVGDFVADFVVEGKMIVELEAVSNLLPVHETQLVSYLKSTGIEVGLLINFGAGSLQFKRKYREYRPSAPSQDRIAGLSGLTGPASAPVSTSLSTFPEPGEAEVPQKQSCSSCQSCNPVKNTRAGRSRAPQKQSCSSCQSCNPVKNPRAGRSMEPSKPSRPS